MIVLEVRFFRYSREKLEVEWERIARWVGVTGTPQKGDLIRFEGKLFKVIDRRWESAITLDIIVAKHES